MHYGRDSQREPKAPKTQNVCTKPKTRHILKINELRFLPGRAIVMYRESDLCAHLIGAVFTFDMMMVVC